MTDLALLCLEMLEADRWTDPGAFRPLGIIALDRTPETATDETTRTLDRRLHRRSAFTDAFAPWLDAYPAPQTPAPLAAFLARRPDASPTRPGRRLTAMPADGAALGPLQIAAMMLASSCATHGVATADLRIKVVRCLPALRTSRLDLQGRPTSFNG